jgi:hypothetical protein
MSINTHAAFCVSDLGHSSQVRHSDLPITILGAPGRRNRSMGRSDSAVTRAEEISYVLMARARSSARIRAALRLASTEEPETSRMGAEKW